MTTGTTAERKVIRALLLATGLCAAFWAYRIWQLGGVAFSYLPWNLFLAWLPLLIIIGLLAYLRRQAWSSWGGVALSLLWLVFLPNSFYMVSDYIHLQEVAPENVLYDSVMFTMFVLTGMLLGYVSLYVFHKQLLRRLPVRRAAQFVAGILLVCSFAIYIGRDLRWNSWDVLTSPGGLLFDLSNRFTHLNQAKDMIGTVALFFALLGGTYIVAWQIIRGVGIAEAPPEKQG